MTITRRHFLETASITALAGAILPGALAQRGRPLNEDTFSPDGMAIFYGVSPQTFKSLIGEDFAASLGGKPLGSLTLIKVNAAAPANQPEPATGARLVGRVPKPSQQATTSFTLRFQGTGAGLEQETYTLNHPALGSFPLFIVPASREVNPPTYTAVFNQLAPSENRLK